MGHLAGKDIYRKLGKKIDGMPSRAPWNETLYEVLKSLYSVEEADVVVKMPFNLSSLERIARITRRKTPELQKVLEGLSEKGLVVDLWVQGRTLYMPSPMVVGIFEFTMMRTGGGLKTKEWAKLFHEYMHGDSNFYAANFGQGQKISIERALPHEGSVHPEDFTEILDHEKAHVIVEQSSRFAIGICSCRHEKLHADKKTCDIPLEMCASFGAAADYLIRRNLAKEAPRTQMHELIDSARELGLVLNADNIQKNVSFICSCCPCCCNTILGVREHGYPGTIVTSSFIARIASESCTGCGNCARDCPIEAIAMVPEKKPDPKSKRKALPVVDSSICLGCGVCTLRCRPGSLRLRKREQRVLHPETNFERILLASLERGTLQNQLFDNPQSLSHAFLRGFLGGFLRLPPVKKALMSDLLRSSFLTFLKKAAALSGQGAFTEI